MAGLLGDQAMHRLAHPPVRRVALGRRAQLDHVHGLPRVHLQVEADPVGHGHRVRADRAEPGPGIASYSAADSSMTRVQSPSAPASRSRRRRVAVARRQALPLEREQPVALEVAERAVVAEDVEAVDGPLEGAAGPVPSVLAAPDVGLEHALALVGGELPRESEELVVGQRGPA